MPAVVRICLCPLTVVLPAAEVLDFEFLISNLFGISILGFRISGLAVAQRHVRLMIVYDLVPVNQSERASSD